jgi:hypothetical protein
MIQLAIPTLLVAPHEMLTGKVVRVTHGDTVPCWWRNPRWRFVWLGSTRLNPSGRYVG